MDKAMVRLSLCSLALFLGTSLKVEAQTWSFTGKMDYWHTFHTADGFPGSVPRAICGPGDHTESGLQGQTTTQERFSGDSERAYNCNLELVGRYRGEGAYSQDGDR